MSSNMPGVSINTHVLPHTVQALEAALTHDLDFHGENSLYGLHDLHAFPAKFPPQLPRLFIEYLTEPGDIVLDPMVGSGTAVLEASASGRRSIGFDIDPLALLLTRVKTSAISPRTADTVGNDILDGAHTALKSTAILKRQLSEKWDRKTKAFIDYWFADETQLELLALINQIEMRAEDDIRDFFRLVFSSIIITKSGGVSLAFDLAHTRPHRAKVVYSQAGELLIGHANAANPSARTKLLTKTLRSPLDEFEKRVKRYCARAMAVSAVGDLPIPNLRHADAQSLPLDENSVDLIVTSPPYISNAIDYMRAHKFSLVWFGYPISELGSRRKQYIGGETITGFDLIELPARVRSIVDQVARQDEKRSRAVHRYYSEMARVLVEMHRVLKPNRSAVLVVGTSIIKGVDTQISQCLAELGKRAGLKVVSIATRNLDRDRRMLPASTATNPTSQIQQRMHKEYVIGFHKSTR